MSTRSRKSIYSCWTSLGPGVCLGLALLYPAGSHSAGPLSVDEVESQILKSQTASGMPGLFNAQQALDKGDYAGALRLLRALIAGNSSGGKSLLPLRPEAWRPDAGKAQTRPVYPQAASVASSVGLPLLPSPTPAPYAESEVEGAAMGNLPSPGLSSQIPSAAVAGDDGAEALLLSTNGEANGSANAGGLVGGTQPAAPSAASTADYADYFHFLAGQAELGLMRKYLRAGAGPKTTAAALAAGERARQEFVEAQLADAYSTLKPAIKATLGQTEIELGEGYLRQRKTIKAMQLMESGFQRLSDPNRLAWVNKHSLLSYAQACQKNPTELCQSWVVRFLPLAAHTAEAKVLARIAAHYRRPPVERVASTNYRVDLDLQAFTQGFNLYLAGKYPQAYETWNGLLKQFPRTTIKLRTKYWMARAAEQAARAPEAETLYRQVIREIPFSYYALLASWHSGLDLGRVLDSEIPMATPESPLLKPADLVHLRKAENLVFCRVPQLAALELKSIQITPDMPNEFLVYLILLNHLAGNHATVFQIYSELNTRGYTGMHSSYGGRILFPVDALDLVQPAARGAKLDPLVVLSVIRQESAFSSEAISGANALGLMQLIVPTARNLERDLDSGDLFRPEKNIELGSRYLGQLLKRFQGNLVLALAGYNAGPGAAERWKRQATRDLGPEEFIELIGYRETREYVENILRNYYWYKRKVRGELAPNLRALMNLPLN